MRRTTGRRSEVARELARFGALLLTVVAPGLASCSLLVSTDGLSDASPEPSPDGGSTPDGASPVDSAVGTDATTTGSGVDGGADASFCSSLSPAPVYCVDFDDGRPLSAFGAVLGQPAPSIDSTVSRSGASSMRIDVPRDPDAGTQSAIAKDLTGTMASYSFSCALRIDPNLASTTYSELASLRFVASGTLYSLVLAIDHSQVKVSEEHGPGGTEISDLIVAAPLPSTASGWVKLRFSGTLGDLAPQLALEIEGLEVDRKPLSTVPAAAGGTPSILYGLYFSAANELAKRFNIDDVVVDYR